MAIQRAVGELPHGPGFGYAASYDDPALHGTWIDVLLDQLGQARGRIEAVGAVSSDCVDRIEDRVASHRPLLDAVRPVCFLDDTTTKNVLVEGGRLSGIVDVDTVCFGDPLLTPALTLMALLDAGHDTDYITYWVDELQINDRQRRLLDLYTALFCVVFLSELGVRFNQSMTPAVDLADIDRRLAILDALMTQTGR